MSARAWWQRLTRRGNHRPGQPRTAESPHAVAAAARTEQARMAEAEQRRREVEAFLHDFRRAFGLNGGTGAHR